MRSDFECEHMARYCTLMIQKIAYRTDKTLSDVHVCIYYETMSK